MQSNTREVSEALRLHSRFCPRAFANLGKLVALLGNETEVNDQSLLKMGSIMRNLFTLGWDPKLKLATPSPSPENHSRTCHGAKQRKRRKRKGKNIPKVGVTWDSKLQPKSIHEISQRTSSHELGLGQFQINRS